MMIDANDAYWSKSNNVESNPAKYYISSTLNNRKQYKLSLDESKPLRKSIQSTGEFPNLRKM